MRKTKFQKIFISEYKKLTDKIEFIKGKAVDLRKKGIHKTDYVLYSKKIEECKNRIKPYLKLRKALLNRYKCEMKKRHNRVKT